MGMIISGYFSNGEEKPRQMEFKNAVSFLLSTKEGHSRSFKKIVIHFIYISGQTRFPVKLVNLRPNRFILGVSGYTGLD